MKLVQFIVVGLMILGSLSISAQTTDSDKSKSASTPAKKSQTRSEFYNTLYKMFKTHKTEQKEAQIQFINKQFNQELEHKKAIIEIQKQLNPKGSPESNKTLIELLEKKNKEFQEKSKSENEKFYKTLLAEKNKSFFEKMQNMTQEYEGIKK